MSSEPGRAAGVVATLKAPAERDPAAEVAARLPITDRPSWLILAGLALLVAGGFVWSVLGSAPDIVSGRGMVVPANGFIEVGAALQGTVGEVSVQPGDTVKAGMIVARMRTEAGLDVDVTTPVDGRVATVLVRAGSVTDRGTALLTIEPAGSVLQVVGYLPAGPGKRVIPGMKVHVGLGSVPPAQYGMLQGVITAVSPVPVSAERVVLVVGGNVTLAEYFLGTGPVLEVTVALQVDASTPTGYAWTTGVGPDTNVSPGTLAEVSVVVSEASPLQRILR